MHERIRKPILALYVNALSINSSHKMTKSNYYVLVSFGLTSSDLDCYYQLVIYYVGIKVNTYISHIYNILRYFISLHI